VEEWEEPLHLGSRSATYPTFSHNTTFLHTFSHLVLPGL
jgi:hypothetical protein